MAEDERMITLNTAHSVVELPQGDIYDFPLTFRLPHDEEKLGYIKVSRNSGDIPLLKVSAGASASQDVVKDSLLSMSQYLLHRENANHIRIEGYHDRLPYSQEDGLVSLTSISDFGRSQATTRVAIVILQNEKGEVLLGLRPQGNYLPGLWEFPGGKIEVGETPLDAARREIEEELGVAIEHCDSLGTLNYSFLTNRLEGHVFLTRIWQGTPVALHHDKILWLDPARLSAFPMPLSAILSLPEIIIHIQ